MGDGGGEGGRQGRRGGGWETGEGRVGDRGGGGGGGRQVYTLPDLDVVSLQAPSLPPLPPLRIDDELLEVIGLYSFLHVGKIQVSLAEPLRLGQASEIKVLSQCSGGCGGGVAVCL